MGCTPHPNSMLRVKAKSPEVQEGVDGCRDFGGAKEGCRSILEGRNRVTLKADAKPRKRFPRHGIRFW